MEPIGMIFAVDATRRHALSALPDAPVVADDAPGANGGQRGPGPVRRTAANGLRRLADRLEPGHAVR